MVLGDGSSTMFWEDRWLDGCSIQDKAMYLVVLIPGHPRKRRSVREVQVERRWIADITGAMSDLALWQYFEDWIWSRSIQL
jgi:hypothetical protein